MILRPAGHDPQPINQTPTNEFHPGKFVWRDLMTDDIPASKKFYSELFGWTYQDVEHGNKDYCIVLQNGKPIAGMFKLQDVKGEQKYSQWISYVSVLHFFDQHLRSRH